MKSIYFMALRCIPCNKLHLMVASKPYHRKGDKVSEFCKYCNSRVMLCVKRSKLQ